MTTQPFPEALVVPDVDEDTHNKNLLRVSKEEGEKIFDTILRAFPKLTISPGISVPPRVRLQRGIERIAEAYQGDMAGATFELSMLLDTEYYDQFKLGLLPPPRSEPFLSLLPLGTMFREWQKTFISDYKAWLGSKAAEGLDDEVWQEEQGIA
jgi:hypothetical protein